MTYYFISGAPEKIRNFLNRFPMLSDAAPLKTQDQLKSIPGNTEVFIFIDLEALPIDMQGMILSIREKLPLAKLIYVTGDKNAHDLKAHQKSPIGGDAYVSFEILASELNDIVEVLAEAPPKLDTKNRLESKSNDEFGDFDGLLAMKNHPLSQQIDEIFKTVIKAEAKRPVWQSAAALVSPEENTDVGESMSTKDQELSFDDGELEISIGEEEPASLAADEGLDLSLDEGEELSLSDGDDLTLDEDANEDDAQFGDLNLDDSEDLSLDEEESLSLSEEEPAENLGELNFSESTEDDELNLSEDTQTPALSLEQSQILDEESLSLSDAEMSDDAMAKLKEIDAIMDFDASQVAIRTNPLQEDAVINEPLVSDDLNLDSISFSNEELADEEEEEKPKKRKKEAKEARESRDLGQDLKEISGAYSGEMERMQATISNLRSDREELLAKIQKLEEDKVLQGRQTLSLRAELDEKKIELTIIRKKLNEEISDLKDRLKLFDEKRLIMEEKNRILAQELDKAAQKNKIDVKKVQMRERELEQKLELLKADAETQIRNRDLKILELKRKIDAMEFDMESISMQEKRSVESRFELEDKLEKAIKTLRSAITVLEDETDRTNALDALKKNIDV